MTTRRSIGLSRGDRGRNPRGEFIVGPDGHPTELPHRFNTGTCDSDEGAQEPRRVESDAELEQMMGMQSSEAIDQTADNDDAADGEAPRRSRD